MTSRTGAASGMGRAMAQEFSANGATVVAVDVRAEPVQETVKLLDKMDQREATILRLRYGLGTDREHTLEEVGRRLFITRERVRQIESKALAKMRASGGRAA